MSNINPFRPRRLRIIEKGWETFSDFFGSVQFLEGVSIEPVSWQEQQRLGGLIQMTSAEIDEDDSQVGPSAELVRNRTTPHDENTETASMAVTTPDGSVRLAAEIVGREELEAIADAKGLAGLRDIGKMWGVKGRSVAELINSIVNAQDAALLTGAPPDHARGEDEVVS